MDLKAFVRDVPDFPSPGILFRDITPLLKDVDAYAHALGLIETAVKAAAPDAICGIESRGFLFAAPLAARMALPFVPVRKPGKLPSARMSIEYALEYGQSQLDIHEDALRPGQRAVIIDDLLATGGTARAAAKLVEVLGARVDAIVFLIELADLNGRAALEGYDVQSFVVYGERA